MQDRMERRNLLKKIEEDISEIRKIEDQMADLRQNLLNSTRRYLTIPMPLTSTGVTVLRQRFGKLADLCLDLEARVYEAQMKIDQIQS